MRVQVKPTGLTWDEAAKTYLAPTQEYIKGLKPATPTLLRAVQTNSMPAGEDPVYYLYPPAEVHAARGEEERARVLVETRRQELVACRAREAPIARDMCEESCGQSVGVSRCVFGMRKCTTRATDNSTEQRICAIGLRECLTKENVVPDQFDRCVTKCQATQVESKCGR